MVAFSPSAVSFVPSLLVTVQLNDLMVAPSFADDIEPSSATCAPSGPADWYFCRGLGLDIDAVEAVNAPM